MRTRWAGSMGRMVVVGAGVAGLSAAWAAASMGFIVTCIEARRVGSEAGSSMGWAKIFRFSYEDQRYSRLMIESERCWGEIEKRTGEKLIEYCPALNITRRDSSDLDALQDSLDSSGRLFKVLYPGDARLDEFGIRLLDDEAGILEMDAGIMRPQATLSALSQVARQAGAEVLEGVKATRIYGMTSSIRVEAGSRCFDADRVIVAAGPWVEDLIHDLSPKLSVTRQYQTVFATPRPVGAGSCVSWVKIDDDDYYGIFNGPDGLHMIGTHKNGENTHPDSPIEIEAVDREMQQQLSFIGPRLGDGVEFKSLSRRVCHYTNTTSGDFLIAPLSGSPEIVILSACSGHGFKFGVIAGMHAVQVAVSQAR